MDNFIGGDLFLAASKINLCFRLILQFISSFIHLVRSGERVNEHKFIASLPNRDSRLPTVQRTRYSVAECVRRSKYPLREAVKQLNLVKKLVAYYRYWQHFRLSFPFDFRRISWDFVSLFYDETMTASDQNKNDDNVCRLVGVLKKHTNSAMKI